jgi:hypothetical protein
VLLLTSCGSSCREHLARTWDTTVLLCSALLCCAVLCCVVFCFAFLCFALICYDFVECKPWPASGPGLAAAAGCIIHSALEPHDMTDDLLGMAGTLVHLVQSGCTV